MDKQKPDKRRTGVRVPRKKTWVEAAQEALEKAEAEYNVHAGLYNHFLDKYNEVVGKQKAKEAELLDRVSRNELDIRLRWLRRHGPRDISKIGTPFPLDDVMQTLAADSAAAAEEIKRTAEKADAKAEELLRNLNAAQERLETAKRALLRARADLEDARTAERGGDARGAD